MKWPNPEMGSHLLACDELYSRLQAQVQQKDSQGMWPYIVLNLSPVQLVHLNSMFVSALTLLDTLFVTSLCCANEVIAPLHWRPSIYSQPWHPNSSLSQRDHQSVLFASWEISCSLMFLSAIVLFALIQSWYSSHRGLIPVSFSTV